MALSSTRKQNISDITEITLAQLDTKGNLYVDLKGDKLFYNPHNELTAWRATLIKRCLYDINCRHFNKYMFLCTSSKPIDNRTGFSSHLKETEKFIWSENWERQKLVLMIQENLKQLKPMLQIDIDHDYVNNIEESFVKLDGYIDAGEKGNSRNYTSNSE